ncbi:hypothetical protein T09_14811, partial [Trichinella sp. T9]
LETILFDGLGVFLTSQLPAMSGCLYRKCQPQLCRFAGNTKDLRMILNDVPLMPVLVHFHIKYEIQHSLGILLLDTDHTCMQYSSHVNSGTKI